jgi:hypothetical protein
MGADVPAEASLPRIGVGAGAAPARPSTPQPSQIRQSSQPRSRGRTRRRPRPAARAPVPRSRLIAAAAAAVAAVVAGGIGFALGDGPTGRPPASAVGPQGPRGPHPGGRTIEGRGILPSVTGRAVLDSKAWGTEIDLTLAGMQRAVGAGVRCRLVVVSAAGARDAAGTWAVPAVSPTPAGEHFVLPTAVSLSEIIQLLVVTADGTEVLAVDV